MKTYPVKIKQKQNIVKVSRSSGREGDSSGGGDRVSCNGNSNSDSSATLTMIFFCFFCIKLFY